MTYWEDTLSEILDDHGIIASRQQVAAIAKDVAGAAEVETEYSGIAERTKPGSPQKSPERVRIDRLEDCIRRLSARFGIGIDPDSMEISYYTPVGTSHMGTTRETL
jgi:3-methyladenine DNA glycosylase Tag